MLNNFIKGISPGVRLISLILLILSLLIANSIYLIIFITILTFILMIIKDKKVNMYVNTPKSDIMLLLITLLGYIIIIREYNIFTLVLILFKLIIILFLIKVFIVDISFKELHEGIYMILKPIKIPNINIEKLSFDFTSSIFFIKYLISSEKEIKIIQTINGKRKLNFKNKFFPMLMFSVNKLESLQNNLKIKLYQLNNKKMNIRSKIVLVLTIIFFVVSIIKEVVL
ncbi:MAG: hypothetical protein E7310_08105 [Clostridiales bacterium]|nr:hypothetical protein [Clostridiales bacterium]